VVVAQLGEKEWQKEIMEGFRSNVEKEVVGLVDYLVRAICEAWVRPHP
jgi:hypothetical protein